LNKTYALLYNLSNVCGVYVGTQYGRARTGGSHWRIDKSTAEEENHARRIRFLYEWLTGEILKLPVAEKDSYQMSDYHEAYRKSVRYV
jgi:hypothetical protein